MRNELIAAATNADGLHLQFVWCGDRFAQVISLIRPDGKVVPLLESVEGSAAEAWPPSPPLQSLSVETLPDGRRAALLVGMAGRGHWSASIEALPVQAALQFDIACRTSDRNPALASSYRLAASSTASLFAAADESWIEMQHGQRAVVISPLRELAASSALKMLATDNFSIAPELQNGTTIRWKYRIELLTSDL